MTGAVSTATDIATMLGVIFAGSQLWMSRKQSRTSFEDQLASQYREIIRRLPIGALLGDELSEEEMDSALPAFLHYFDLCNEQVYLRNKHRIDKVTWKEWDEGIHQNLRRPAFAKAWQIITTRAPDIFDELRAISPPRASFELHTCEKGLGYDAGSRSIRS